MNIPWDGRVLRRPQIEDRDLYFRLRRGADSYLDNVGADYRCMAPKRWNLRSTVKIADEMRRNVGPGSCFEAPYLEISRSASGPLVRLLSGRRWAAAPEARAVS